MDRLAPRDLAEGQGLDHGAIQLTKSVAVTIRINAPLSLLKAANAAASPLVIGVRDRWGRYHPSRETSVNPVRPYFSGGRPLWDGAERLAAQLAFSDAAGVPMNRLGAKTPFQVASDGPAPAFVFNIAGEAKP
jgi:hypothetical protein